MSTQYEYYCRRHACHVAQHLEDILNVLEHCNKAARLLDNYSLLCWIMERKQEGLEGVCTQVGATSI